MKFEYLVMSRLEDFEEKVSSRLEEGWKLHGGTTCCLAHGLIYYCQALTWGYEE